MQESQFWVLCLLIVFTNQKEKSHGKKIWTMVYMSLVSIEMKYFLQFFQQGYWACSIIQTPEPELQNLPNDPCNDGNCSALRSCKGEVFVEKNMLAKCIIIRSEKTD